MPPKLGVARSNRARVTIRSPRSCSRRTDRRSKTRAEDDEFLAAPVPSIKGSIFGRAVQDLLKLVTEGQISRAELEAKLAPGDAAYLDRSIQAAGWYDV